MFLVWEYTAYYFLSSYFLSPIAYWVNTTIPDCLLNIQNKAESPTQAKETSPPLVLLTESDDERSDGTIIQSVEKTKKMSYLKVRSYYLNSGVVVVVYYWCVPQGSYVVV